jgi:hypothetical protein
MNGKQIWQWLAGFSVLAAVCAAPVAYAAKVVVGLVILKLRRQRWQ